MAKYTEPVMATLLILLGTACGLTMASYSGDGRFVDNGPLAETDRYVIDLGPLTLTRKSEKKFRLADLPKSSFVVGLRLLPTARSSAPLNAQVGNPIVSMELKRGDGTSVFHITSPLRQWTWSLPSTGTSAFIYYRDKPSSFFLSETRTTYFLTIAVLEPAAAAGGVDVNVQVKSGGLK